MNHTLIRRSEFFNLNGRFKTFVQSELNSSRVIHGLVESTKISEMRRSNFRASVIIVLSSWYSRVISNLDPSDNNSWYIERLAKKSGDFQY